MPNSSRRTRTIWRRGRLVAALALGLMAMPQLPASRREIWRKMFDHYVFQTEGDPVPYLPPDRRGILGPLNPRLENYMREKLIKALTRPHS